MATCLVIAASSALAEEAAAPAPGEEPHAKSADEIAKELANPNNDLAKLTFKNQFRWYEGDLPDADDQSNYTLLFQPVFPFSLGTTDSGAKEILFIRPAIPLLVDQPVPGLDGNGQFDWDEQTAMGDWGFDLAYAQTHKDGFLWAAGMVGTLPLASDSAVAGKQLRLGPEFLIAKITKAGTFGIFPSHQWDVTGWNEGKEKSFSTTSIQPLVIFTPGGGWQVASKPIMTYDWKGEEWTIPVALSVAKTIIAGQTPLQIEVELNYYVEKPDAFGPEWMLSFNLTPVVPNFIESMFKGK